MKHILISFFLLFGICFAATHKERNILFNVFKDKTQSLDNLDNWRNQIRDDFKQNVLKLPESVKQSIVETADKVLQTKWEPLLAMNYLEFKINGNRDHYEGKNFNRRKNLEVLVLAEVLTDKGKYVNEIANGIWIILEESTWTWPAHVGVQKAGVGLPDPTEFVLDLGAGETSAYVSWLKLLVGDKLYKLCPIFEKRIEYELNRRIIEPYLHTNISYTLGWMGLNGQKVNNWNVWINTNVLMTTLLNIKQNETLVLFKRIVNSTDDWINWYGDDGGCDEGPAYWYQAAGRFIQFLYFMTSASQQKLDFSSNKLFDKIGSYIYKMHIDGQYFVNFADAGPTEIPDPTLVYRYGQMFNNPLMKGFAAFLYQLAGGEGYLKSDEISGNLHLFYLQMTAYNQLKTTVPKAPQPIESWFPDLQVLTTRSVEGSGKGLFLGAKAGTNGESHNHNDVGNFIIYVNGKPAIIDVGVGTYTAKTFGPHRYDIWAMQSQWHNTPTINGIQQHDGDSFKAINVGYIATSSGGHFAADIAGAYPEEAQVKSWLRNITFDRNANTIEMMETYSLNQFIEPTKIHFITALNVTQKASEVVFENKDTKLTMKYNTELFSIVIDDHKTDDEKLAHYWGDKVNRVSLVTKTKELVGKHSVIFQL